MPNARIYFFDDQGRIKFGDWIDCGGLEDAHRIARDHVDRHAAVEIWNRATRLVRVEREERDEAA
jgi:hypothetical protein